jgi:hypothetical protein
MRHAKILILFLLVLLPGAVRVDAQITRTQAEGALRKAAQFYREKVSTKGGYHYYYAEDLSYGRSEHGEGPTQIEVQREATPIVGLGLSPRL